MESLFAKEELENEIIELKIQLLSRFYPFRLNEIQALIKHIDFDSLIRNEEICWSKELFDLLKDEIDWSLIHFIRKLNFRIDQSFLTEFENYVDFESLLMTNHVDWSIEIFNKFKEKISHKVLYRSNELFTNKKVFAYFESKIEWDFLSRSTKLEFPIDFIEVHKNLINWKIFSKNPNIPVSVDFIKKFENFIDFDGLSQNPSCIELILKYSKSKKWNWRTVMYNPAIEFDDDNINFYAENFNKYLYETGKIKVFYKNFPGLIVRHLMVNQIKNRNYFIQDKYLELIPWDIFCTYCNTELTLQEIEKFKSKLDFKSSQFLIKHRNIITTDFILENIELFDSKSPSFYQLPLNLEIIEKCSNISFNMLSGCDKFDWTWQFIQENIDKLNIYRLSKNKALYDLIDLSDPFIPELDELFPLKVGDVISFREKGNVLYCVHEILFGDDDLIEIGFRSKFGEIFYESDVSKFHKHNNITSIEFDIDTDFELHKKRIYTRAYNEVESLEDEIWKEVKGFENLLASNMGRILSKSGALKPRILKVAANSNGQLFFMRKKKASSSNWSYQVALIVAETFLPNPKRYKYINHINSDNSDNRIENLEWVKHGKIEQTPYQESLKKKIQKENKFTSQESDFFHEDDPYVRTYNEPYPNSDLGWLDEETDGQWRWNID